MSIIPKGSEPASIKKRMDTLFTKLDDAYPDKVIRSLQKDHKKWSETVRELYRLLGYPDGNSFLEAYGYTVQRAESGRPKTNNYDEVIEKLRKRYTDGKLLQESFSVFLTQSRTQQGKYIELKPVTDMTDMSDD